MATLQVIYTTETNGQYVANYPYRPDFFETQEIFKQRLTDLFTLSFYIKPLTRVDKEAIYEYKTSNEGKPPITAMDYKPERLPALVKISCCIYTEDGETVNEKPWYYEANGKIYF